MSGVSKVRSVFVLIRVHHYIKNFLVFFPLIYSLGFLDLAQVFIAAVGFVLFCVTTSIVYVLNDLKDVERDRQHSTKKNRPLASGALSVRAAGVILVVLVVVAAVFQCILYFLAPAASLAGLIVLLFYLAVNIAYSLGWKQVPILDVTIIASGFLLRVVFGGLILGAPVSAWMLLTVTMGAFYLGFGKRRNELQRENGQTRKVLALYTRDFLDKNMYMCQALSVVFYSLWTIDPATVEKFQTSNFLFTVPLVLLVFFRYNLSIESQGDGDPTTVLFQDRVLMALVALLFFASIAFILLPRLGL